LITFFSIKNCLVDCSNADAENEHSDSEEELHLSDTDDVNIDLKNLNNEIKSYIALPKTTVKKFYGSKISKQKYRRLNLAAMKILCIPATSTPCERLFSHTGFQVNQTRSSSILRK
jgi:hypothetical protein